MAPSDLEAVEYGVALVVKSVVCYWIVRLDEMWLAKHDPARLERAWPASTRLSATVAFQEIALLLYFARVRRWRWGGKALGVVAAFAADALTVLVLSVVE